MAGGKKPVQTDKGDGSGSKSPPRSPARRSRSPSRSPRRGRSRKIRGRELAAPVMQKVIREFGSVNWPMLTKSNYNDWLLLMKVKLEARDYWDAVKHSDVDFHEDRMALEAILGAVPPEMVGTLAVKPSAKAAWDAIATMHIGGNRVRAAKAESLARNFETIGFHNGEAVDDFAMRLGSMVTNLNILGDKVTEEKAVRKFLRVVPPRYSQIALSIETLVDLDTLSIEDLTGHLKAAEERLDHGGSGQAGGNLLFTEEQWLARYKQREQGKGSSRGGGHGGGRGGGRGRGRGRGGKGKDNAPGDGAPGGGRGSSGGGSRFKGNCHNCGIQGHMARDCTKPKQQRKEEANLNQVQEDQPALLMAMSCGLAQIHVEPARERVFLNEKGMIAVQTACNAWYLDTGASNHMTGVRVVFSALDETVTGTVRFGDGSSVDIHGRGTVVFNCRNKSHRALTGVYYIPQLRSSIVSIGQLDEVGCRTVVEDGVMSIFDQERFCLRA
ncbi:uncharacterized protein [Aegilops tauschii subsp. strangulata]|uniref:uncharacterized protein n=1 Tax=Aegilops tauschii subsp. strangulata TaxID=200361 RepID=UPI003CC8705A